MRQVKPKLAKPEADSSPRPQREAELAVSSLSNSLEISRFSIDDDLRRQWLAYGLKYDIQTGLLNTQSFQEAMEGLLRQKSSAELGVAVLWIDVLNLHKEFTLWGWAGADALVRHLAGLLRSSVDEESLISRFSGCFVVALRRAKSDAGTRRRIQAIVDELAQTVPEFEMVPEVAAGVAFYPADADSADDLARYASLAAIAAGENHLRTVLPFQPGMNHRLMRDHEIEVEIDKALELGSMRMVYQPKVDLASGRVLGTEALIRWTHSSWGDVPPSEFIPIAERSELIHRIFDFGLRRALEDARGWGAKGYAAPIMSINVSPATLRRSDFPRRVRNILSEIPIGPTQLELEVTESLLLDDEKLFAARLRQLKAIGVRIAVDDFGTRYTGFELLGRLPFDVMKIDRCFIRGIHRSHDLRALCNTIVAMGRHLKMRTVAEGIEEPEELAVLQRMGCEAGQGFLIQPPLVAEDFAAFQRTWAKRSSELGFAVEEAERNASAIYGNS